MTDSWEDILRLDHTENLSSRIHHISHFLWSRLEFHPRREPSFINNPDNGWRGWQWCQKMCPGWPHNTQLNVPQMGITGSSLNISPGRLGTGPSSILQNYSRFEFLLSNYNSGACPGPAQPRDIMVSQYSLYKIYWPEKYFPDTFNTKNWPDDPHNFCSELYSTPASIWSS